MTITTQEPQPDKLPDPGVEAHIDRYTDVDKGAAARATRLIVTLFGVVTPLMALTFVVSYFAVRKGVYVNIIFAKVELQHLIMGVSAGIALLAIGIGLEHWAKQLMADHEVVEERHPAASSDEDRKTFVGMVDDGIAEAGIARRPLILASLAGGLGLAVVPAAITLADLGPWPGPGTRKATIMKTLWAQGVRLVTETTRRPIKASEIQIGQLIQAEPESLKDLHGVEYNQANSKAPVVIVRMKPSDMKVPESRKDWHVDGVICYSKICTHVGCPVSLYEQDTHNLLCPCHQSTFALADSGVVVFGPAARSLPQLPIAVDKDGYLIAQSDFTVPVGPSFFERDSRKDFQKGDR